MHSDPLHIQRRYRILETLGKGGFGVVYRAEMTDAGGFAKQVALKVLHSDAEIPDDVISRLRDEARILGLLHHRSIVKVDGLVKLSDGWAVVLEYIEGINYSHLVRNTEVPTTVVLEIIEEVAAALHHAYSSVNPITSEPLHLIHRDIKPSNIRITHLGEVKVLDFGAARADFDEREALTTSFRYGTVRYMSPERHDGFEDHSCDVYALGLLLAEGLAGKRFPEPPVHPRRHGSFVQETVGDVGASWGKQPQLPELVTLLTSMLNYEAEERPAADEVLRSLRAIRKELAGPQLRIWSEEAVPPLIEALNKHLQSRGQDPVSGKELILEQASKANQVDAWPEDSVTRTRRNIILVGTAATMFVPLVIVILILLFLIAGTLYYYSWNQPEPTAEIVPEMILTPVPAKEVEPKKPKPEQPAPTQPEPVQPEPKPPEPTQPPQPKPEPKPAKPPVLPPEPAPEQPSAELGTHTAKVSFAAQPDQKIRLTQGGRVVSTAGGVKPGQYGIQLSLDNGKNWIPAGRAAIVSGVSVRISCSSVMMTCSPKWK